jgi:hypothetical protein
MEGFRELFENPAFRPDGLKIYPTLVIRGTGAFAKSCFVVVVIIVCCFNTLLPFHQDCMSYGEQGATRISPPIDWWIWLRNC